MTQPTLYSGPINTEAPRKAPAMNPISDTKTRRAFNKALRSKGVPAKACVACYTVRSASQFRTDNQKHDGLSTKCRPCFASGYAANPRLSEEALARQRRNPERTRENNRKAVKRYRARRSDDPEYKLKNAERCRAYRTENPERFKASVKRWRDANPDRDRENRAQWRANNPDKVREYSARWRAENPDKVREYGAAWRVANADRVNEYASKRRALKSRAPHQPYNRAELFERWDYKCCYCDAPATDVEHILPISKGGADALHNLTIACQPCNSSKGAKTLAEWAATF